jgi:hypothetical protein
LLEMNALQLCLHPGLFLTMLLHLSSFVSPLWSGFESILLSVIFQSVHLKGMKEHFHPFQRLGIESCVDRSCDESEAVNL